MPDQQDDWKRLAAESAVAEIVSGAMRRGEGALVVRRIETATVLALRTWQIGRAHV